jgi:hexosaminidase
MKAKAFFILLSILCLLTIYGLSENTAKTKPGIVPVPSMIKMLTGTYTIKDSSDLLFTAGNAELKKTAELFAEQLINAGGPVLKILGVGKDYKSLPGIILVVKPVDKPSEGYELKITQRNIIITGESAAGVFYGIQSLLQLLPPEVFANKAQSTEVRWEVPCLDIKDRPRYPYRGMHLDVSRHFFPKEFIKRYIDLIAMYKMNTFQWHLTDDNGWRIEIKKYPKLMSISAWRVDREELPWKKRPPQKPGEKATYGGYYTQDEVREIIAYAKERYVTIIPEIEMPAHCLGVLAAYPQLSCTGGPFTVAPGDYSPNLDIFCAGNDSTFRFIEDVLSEVIELFPSSYIHIGGDEAKKTRWQECPKCQARMKSEGLKNEKELQSWFIKKVEKFLQTKNKKLIGWDEILEGGLAPEATVMSWRGIDGGISAARQGHDVIMTPTSYCYFDFYQADTNFEPKAIGGFTTLKKVYSFEPIPAELTPAQSKHILGAQGNLWTEYIPTTKQAEYMAVPRMIALAEVVWSQKKDRNWKDFRYRMKDQFKRLDHMQVNYSKGSFKVDVSTSYDRKKAILEAHLSSEQLDIPISYTLNGNDPVPTSPVYTEPIDIKGNGYLKAGLFIDGKLKEKFTERNIMVHKAVGKKVTYLKPYSYRYTGGGDGALNDGLRGTVNWREGNWQGFQGNDLEVVIDMEKVAPVRSVFITFLHQPESWIFMPDSVTFSLSSDGKRFHSINEYRNDVSLKQKGPAIKPYSHIFPDTPARYIKVRAKNVGICPSWHEGKGEHCWLFADEIVVY